MKIILFIFFFGLSTISSAQDPRLFENDWYLYEVMSSDLGTLFEVSLINPPITPYLTISEDLSYSGEGACNTFNGVYEIFMGDLNSTSFDATTVDCGIQQHNRFEDEYFGFISGGYWYTITEDSQGKILTFETPIFGYAVFKSYPLSAPDFQKPQFQLYPNPAKEILILSATNTTGNLKVTVYNIEGKLLDTQNLEFETQTSIDVSNLKSGIYFLNIEDGNGRVEMRRFIKE